MLIRAGDRIQTQSLHVTTMLCCFPPPHCGAVPGILPGELTCPQQNLFSIDIESLAAMEGLHVGSL